MVQVATKLAEVVQQQSDTKGGTDDLDDEDKLLEDPKGDTPIPTPPGSPPKVPQSHAPPNGGGDVNMNSPDAIADRVNHIFGKRGASETLESGSKPKVSNTGDLSSAEEDAEATPKIPPGQYKTDVPGSESKSVNKDDETLAKEVDMEVGDDDGEAGGNNVAIVEEEEDDDDGEWPEDDDQPEAYPDIAFPIDPPTYPRQPEFEYRYRAGRASNPKQRRLDFQKAINLRPCRRDPYSGRISQEEYDAREDAEMMLSLGYVYTL